MLKPSALAEHIKNNGFSHYYVSNPGALFLLRPAIRPDYQGMWAQQVVLRRRGEPWYLDDPIQIWAFPDIAERDERIRPTNNGRDWWPILHNLPLEERMQRVITYHRKGIITDWQLWEVLGYDGIPNWLFTGPQAIQIYQELGYEPLAGYPLVKKIEKGEPVKNG
ncbi:MAG: hypothetical protein KJ077_10750 [Anaerolineae bacterium]|nr:hypothetical protein [Anaerolineae bacterium]